MARTLTASDRRSLIRLASTLPAGSEERRAILAGLKQAADDPHPFGERDKNPRLAGRLRWFRESGESFWELRDGNRLLGYVVEEDGLYKAEDPVERILGEFDDYDEAQLAVEKAVGVTVPRRRASDNPRLASAGLKQAHASRTASLDGLEYDDSLAYKIFGASLWKLREKGTLNRNQYRKIEEALEKCLKRVLS